MSMGHTHIAHIIRMIAALGWLSIKAHSGALPSRLILNIECACDRPRRSHGDSDRTAQPAHRQAGGVQYYAVVWQMALSAPALTFAFGFLVFEIHLEMV